MNYKQTHIPPAISLRWYKTQVCVWGVTLVSFDHRYNTFSHANPNMAMHMAR